MRCEKIVSFIQEEALQKHLVRVHRGFTLLSQWKIFRYENIKRVRGEQRSKMLFILI